MTPQHFKETLETICKTTGYSKTEIASFIGISLTQLGEWQKRPPKAMKYVALQLFRELLSEHKGLRSNVQ